MADRYSCSYRRDHTEISRSSHTSSHYFTSSNNPSFSSTLLEEIYRSIDQGGDDIAICRESMRKKRDDANSRAVVFKSDEEMANYQRACMIEKWMEKKVIEKVVVRGKFMADLQVKMSRKDRQCSSSSSSDSSCGGDGGGFFSSSETESFPVERLKPVRTGRVEYEKDKAAKNRRDSEIYRHDKRAFSDQSEPKSKHDGGFLKTKSRALKIYGDLKKVRQPISPGGKVAAFLNSLFTARNLKKPKVGATSGDDSPSLKSTNASMCSSASSFSRSCLSKTPSSKSSVGGKRSVRFSPIIDEDCQQCDHKTLHQENNNNNNNINFIKTAIDEELMMHIMAKNPRVEEAAGDFLKNYQKKDQMGCEYELQFDHLSKTHVENRGFDQELDEEEDEDDDFDGASYASSDLFELDNLSAIGIERYREELPVYETTNLGKIQTIANGLIL